MVNAPGTYGAQAVDPDDGWGPATSIRAGGGYGPPARLDPADPYRGSAYQADPYGAEPYGADPYSSGARGGYPGAATAQPAATERGLPSWAALLVLIVIAAIGGTVDLLTGTQVRGGFNISLIVASLVAIVVVRRSGMFPVVIAPPIVYCAATAVLVIYRGGGIHDKQVTLDAALNLAVYGFPAIAAASAAVLIVAGIRLILHR